MAVTATARQSEGRNPEDGDSDAWDTDPNSDPQDEDARRHWQLGRVEARPAEVADTAVTFRGSVRSSYDTDYEVGVALFYRPRREQQEGTSWQQIAEDSGALSEGVYLEATETGLDAGTTYQYRTVAALADYEGESRRVSEIREVTAGEPCSGPSTNCLRAETLGPEVTDGDVTLRGRATGLDSYESVTGHFFYRREDESEQWTDFEPIGGEADGGTDTAEFSATLSDLPAGTYAYYAEVRGEGGELKNMYAEGEEQEFRLE